MQIAAPTNSQFPISKYVPLSPKACFILFAISSLACLCFKEFRSFVQQACNNTKAGFLKAATLTCNTLEKHPFPLAIFLSGIILSYSKYAVLGYALLGIGGITLITKLILDLSLHQTSRSRNMAVLLQAVDNNPSLQKKKEIEALHKLVEEYVENEPNKQEQAKILTEIEEQDSPSFVLLSRLVVKSILTKGATFSFVPESTQKTIKALQKTYNNFTKQQQVQIDKLLLQQKEDNTPPQSPIKAPFLQDAEKLIFDHFVQGNPLFYTSLDKLVDKIKSCTKCSLLRAS